MTEHRTQTPTTDDTSYEMTEEEKATREELRQFFEEEVRKIGLEDGCVLPDLNREPPL